MMQFCGDYEATLQPGGSHPFLYDRGNESPEGSDTGGHNGWVRTLIHEYAHTICAGNIDAPPVMQRGHEAYQSRHGIFPSDSPATNPDSYAFFAMEVSRLQ